jgi:hypothetical protein
VRSLPEWCIDGLMADLYQDRWITCTEDALVIRWYYLWGAKRIPYTAISQGGSHVMWQLEIFASRPAVV